MANFTDEELDRLESYCTHGIGDHYVGYLSGQMLRLIFEIREQRGHSQHQLTKTRAAIILVEEAEKKYTLEQEQYALEQEQDT